jgi:C-terminal processing protease CtpA/Prc
MNKLILIIIANLFLTGGCTIDKQEDPSSKKISIYRAQEDFEIFGNILKKTHPSLNLYISEERLTSLLDSIKSSIPEQLTIRDFYNKITFIANEVGCSHTIAALPGYMYDTLQNRNFFFPYPVKWLDNKLLVNVTGYDLPAGTEIKYINNEPVEQIIKNLMPYNSVEGFHRKTQENLAGEDFSTEYFFKYGKQKKFDLQIKDTLGTERKITENPISLSEWDIRNYSHKYYFDLTEIDYDLSIYDDKQYAYLRMGTFEFDGTQKQNAYENFCYNSFELLKNKKNIKSLIIDLRENIGGDLYNAFLLYSFLADKPFSEYENVISKINIIPYFTYLDPDFANNKRTEINDRLKDEFSKRTKNNYYAIPDSLIEKWQPDKFHYSGDVYVITNSTVVSAASYFALMVKNAGRGKIVGEETTGGAYSGNGFTTLKYILPNSKISVNFPYAHMIYSFKEKKNTGHGLLPDYHVPDSYESFKENEDRQLTFILDSLIQNKKK